MPARNAVSSQAFTIDPGLLRNQVQIQQQTTTQDSVGQPQQTWSTILTAWAQIATAKAVERYQTAQFVAQVSHIITIRYSGSGVSLTAGMRVVFGARTFVVQWVENPMERSFVLRLMSLEINGTL